MTLNHKVTIDINAVAKAAKVSASTVSRCFNHPHLVKASTRRRIDRAVERLGYIRNRAAQAMHGRRSATIGLIVPTINTPIFAEVMQSFSEAVDALGFTILVATHSYDLDREYAVLRKLMEHRVDGVALIGLDHAEATYRLIEQQATPAIAIWNYAAQSRISCVGAENIAAGSLAARHLVDLGHRDIALVFPPFSNNDRARERMMGAEQCLKDAGLPVPEDRRATAPYSIAEAKAACAEMLARSSRPTAILCANDVIAQGALHAARATGLDVPGEVSVIGIGDFAGSAEIEPPLTTIRIPAKRIGDRAGRELVRLIGEPATETPVRINFDVDLLMRATTAPPRVPD